MSKATKGLIAGIIVVVLLAAAAIVLKITEPKTEDEGQKITSKLAYEKSYLDVKSIDIKNASGEIHLSKDDQGNWFSEEYKNEELDMVFIETVARSVSKVTLRDVINENPDDLSHFGLDKPLVVAEVIFNDDTVKKLKIGNKMAKEGFSYFQIDGDKAVYNVMDIEFDSLTYDPTSVLNRTFLEEPESGQDWPKIDYIEIERKDLPYNIKLEYDEEADDKVTSMVVATHKMVLPINVQLNPDKAGSAVKGLFGLKARSIVKVNPTEEELKQAGIILSTDSEEKSAAVVKMLSQGQIYTLLIGNTIPEFGEIYGYMNGKNILFGFDIDDLPWLTLKPTDITDTSLVSYGIYDVSKLEVSSGNSKSIFELSGDETATFKATLNNKDISKEYFQKFFKFILNSSGDEIYLDTPKAEEPSATIILTRRKGDNEEIRLDFYDNGNKTAVIVQNGKPIYTCRMSYVEALQKNIKLLESQGELITVW